MARRLALLAAFVLALTVPATAAARPYGFLATPTDQLAVPGHLAGFEITPEGFLYGGYGELVMRAGPNLVGLRAPVRTLHGGRYPLMRYGQRIAGVRYDVETFASIVAGQPVALLRVVLRNETARPLQARWAVGMRSSGGALKPSGVRRFRFPRPAVPQLPGLYTQPGWLFDPAAVRVRRPRDPARRPRHGDVPPPGAGRRARAAAARGHRPGRCRRRSSGSPSTASRSARAATRRLDFVVPSRAGPGRHAGGARAARRAVHRAPRRDAARRGRRRSRGRWQLVLPERRVQDAYYASLMHILLPRYQLPDGDWVQPVNKLRYHAFWLRDASIMTQALDLVGLHREAGENVALLRSLAARQRPVHLARGPARRPRPGDVGDRRARAAQRRPRVRPRGVALAGPRGRLARAGRRKADELGLVPPSDPRDNELVAGHLAGDDFWAVAGLEAAVGVARMLGDAERAEDWQAELASLRATVRERVADAAARNGGAIPPALDRAGGRDWGNLWAAWPSPVLDPLSPLVTRTLARARGHFREGLATYGEFHNLHHYLGFRVWQTELLRGEQARVVQGLYDSLAHTTNTNGGFETGVRPYARRSVDDNLAPHGWFAAELVALLRNMLVRESGAGLELLVGGAGALAGSRPPDGRAGRADEARAGRRDAAAGPRRRRADVEGRRAGGHAAVVAGARGGPRRARAGPGRGRRRRCSCPAGPGVLRIAWRLPRRSSSFDGVTAALQKAYRERGLKPPA